MISYTIIIPHRNSPLLLQRLLRSIPYREDIQIIVVDDNSDANAITILESFKDSYVNVCFYFQKENQGAGAARNVGLKHALGKWLLFADADDFFNECFLDSVDRYLLSDNDIVYFSANSVYSDSLKPGFRDREIIEMINQAISTGNFDELRYKHHGPVSKMINSSFVKRHGFTFDETMANNDAMFSVKTGFFAQKIQVDNSPIYCISCSSNSISHKSTLNLTIDRLYVNQRINHFLRNIEKDKYVINLIPYILCVHDFSLKAIRARLNILSLKYYFIYMWSDLYKLMLLDFRKISKRRNASKQMN